MEREISIMDLLEREKWLVSDYNSNIGIIPVWEEEKERNLQRDEADKKEFPGQYDGFWMECAMEYSKKAAEAQEEADRLKAEIADIRGQIREKLGL